MTTQEIDQAIGYIESGNKNRAMQILAKIINANPRNEKAWICLSFCVDEQNRQLYCLRKAYDINPENERIRNLIIKLDPNFVMIIEPDEQINESEARKLEQNQTIENATAKKNKHKTSNKTLPNLALENIKRAANNQRIRISTNHDSMKSVSAPANKKGVVPKSTKKKALKEEILTRHLEDNSSSRFREGINQSSRLETGMYGNTIIVDGRRFSLFDGPPCLKVNSDTGEEKCDSCDYFSPEDCLLRFDDYLIEDLNRFTTMYVEKQVAIAKRSRIISKIIHDELKAHGRQSALFNDLKNH